jgi:lipopolysaccharide transport system ATP-binding protein
MTTMTDEPQGAVEMICEVEPVRDDWIIRASEVRKKYCRDLRRSLWYGVSDILGAFSLRRVPREALREHEFWAVDNFSFELRRGDCLGLLGRNGAGKSTLIKLLTGQRSLTSGTVQSRGRIVALTELGLGFDPVLTGRENAYVNASVHGVSKRQFDKLIERIIDFSELREFIDSAVHTYSTGMKARLGFSVATHLSPDILIVDEVLAVGDLEFRRKCVQHIQAYLNNRGSVVLVAHDPYLVQSICNRAIVLERGKVVFEGSALEGVDFHFRMGHANMYAAAVSTEPAAEPAAFDTEPLPEQLAAGGEGESSMESTEKVAAQVTALPMEAANKPYQLELTQSRQVVIDRISVVPLEGDTLRTGYAVKVSFDYRSRMECEVGWAFTICTHDLQVSIASCALGLDGASCKLLVGEHTLSCVLPELSLQAGVYAIRGGIGELKSQSGLAARGYEDAPHFFTVAPPKLTKTSNWQVMQADLVTMKVEWLP